MSWVDHPGWVEFGWVEDEETRRRQLALKAKRTVLQFKAERAPQQYKAERAAQQYKAS